MDKVHSMQKILEHYHFYSVVFDGVNRMLDGQIDKNVRKQVDPKHIS